MKWQGIVVNPFLNTFIAAACGVGLSVVVVTLTRHLLFSEYIIGTKRCMPPVGQSTSKNQPAAVTS